jgi:uncharacterized protein involved in exopolysaccharide biosynthesis
MPSFLDDTRLIESRTGLEAAQPAALPLPGFEVSLLNLLAELAQNKALVAKIAAAVTLIGLVFACTLPVRYTSVTRLMPPQQTQPAASMMLNQLAGAGAGSLAALTGGGLSLKNPNDIYLGLLTSRPVADAIIDRFGLRVVYRSTDMTEARRTLSENSAVSSEKNGFIAVAVTDRDPNRAAAMANAYTEQLRALTKTLAVTEATHRRLFYEDQLKQAREALITAEAGFEQVEQNKGLVQLDAQARAMIESQAQLRAQTEAKQVQVQALRSFSTEHNPSLELAERELAALEAETAHLEERNSGAGVSHLRLGNVPDAGMAYLRAEHEVKYRQTIFDLLLRQYDAAGLDEAKDAAVIQVVEPGIPPERKSSPHRAAILVLSALFGLILGCCWVLAQRAADQNPEMARSLENLRASFAFRRS